MKNGKRGLSGLKVTMCALVFGVFALYGNILGTPADILSKIGTSNGIVAVLNDPNCDLAVGLAKISNLILYVHLNPLEDLAFARRLLDSLGYFGTRVYVEKDKNGKLPFADNLLDAVVSAGTPSIADAEILRALHPGGKAILDQREFVKPAVPGMDDWSHPHYGPDNSIYSRDTAIKPPYLTKFMARPWYGPMPQAVVSAGGRVFRAFGNIAFQTLAEPWMNTVVTFNAFNGTVLWTRPLSQGYMVDRNFMIATPDTLFIGDTSACLYVNTSTGALMDRFIPPVSGGTFFKWMGRENGIIYAVVGKRDQTDPDVKWHAGTGGWNWPALSAGYTQAANPWGFGKTVIAFNPGTKSLLWSHTETDSMDCRSVCMKNSRIFMFNWGKYLACLNAVTGAEVWRRTPSDAPEIFGSIGTYSEAYGEAESGWRTMPYLKCNSSAVFIGSTRNTDGKIVAVNAATGARLWSNFEGSSRLIVSDNEVYAVGGYTTRINAMTGAQILRDGGIGGAACAAVSGCAGGIFSRGNIGTTRTVPATFDMQGFFPMRPDCNTGVTIGNGQLYWWPWGCKCSYTLWGILSVGGAGSFVHTQPAVESERLERSAGDIANTAPFNLSANDWRGFRKDSAGGAASDATVPAAGMHLMWKFTPRADAAQTTAPSAGGGLGFFCGQDGSVYAYEIATGVLKWKAYTGGVIRFPPTLWNGRAYVGSGDGWAYCFEAATGRLLWRFQGAPEERKIPVYGTLLSTWPAAAGVLVKDSIAYFAAGNASHDGIHLYALNALNGGLRWQNNTAGLTQPGGAGGVAVQGQMAIGGNVLYLAGGTIKSPGAFDIGTGQAIDSLTGKNGNTGEDLYILGGKAYVSGKIFCLDAPSPGQKTFMTSNSAKTLFWNWKSYVSETVKLYNNGDIPGNALPAWLSAPMQTPLWQLDLGSSPVLKGVALTGNAVITLKSAPNALTACGISGGSQMWSLTLPSAPMQWGLAVDANGQVLVTLQTGEVLCYGNGGASVEEQVVFTGPRPALSLELGSSNPFNAMTILHYALARDARITLTVTDVRGQVVKTLVDQVQIPGRFIATWDGTDNRGKTVGSGFYHCTLRSKDLVKRVKLCMIK